MTLVSERKVNGAYRSAGYHVVQERGPYRGKRNEFDPTVKWMYHPAVLLLVRVITEPLLLLYRE